MKKKILSIIQNKNMLAHTISYLSTYTYIYIYKYMYIYIYTHTHKYTYIHIYIYKYIQLYIYILYTQTNLCFPKIYTIIQIEGKFRLYDCLSLKYDYLCNIIQQKCYISTNVSICFLLSLFHPPVSAALPFSHQLIFLRHYL